MPDAWKKRRRFCDVSRHWAVGWVRSSRSAAGWINARSRGSTCERPVSGRRRRCWRAVAQRGLARAGSPTLTLSRCEEDYFLSAGAVPVAVNDRAATGKLLATGDRIAVGPRGRIEFRRPNAASGTAVLQISGARLPWGGVREVLLMDREIVLGASAAAHI